MAVYILKNSLYRAIPSQYRKADSRPRIRLTINHFNRENKMSKRSTTNLATVLPSPRDSRPPAPENFSLRAKEIWIDITNAKPHDWFTVDNVALLQSYVLAIETFELVSVDIAAGRDECRGIKSMKIHYDLQAQQSGLIQLLATKKRLAQQSRYSAMTPATATSKDFGGRPWE